MRPSKQFLFGKIETKFTTTYKSIISGRSAVILKTPRKGVTQSIRSMSFPSNDPGLIFRTWRYSISSKEDSPKRFYCREIWKPLPRNKFLAAGPALERSRESVKLFRSFHDSFHSFQPAG